MNGELGGTGRVMVGSRAAAPSTVRLLASNEQKWDVWYGRLWPGRIHHPASMCVRFPALDVGTLETAVTELVRRNDILRTTFHVVDGVVQRIISEPTSVRVPIVDLYHPGGERGHDEVLRFVAKAVGESFHLEHGPLFRPNLARVAPDEHLFIGVLHHAVCDERSARVLEGALISLYADLSAGRPSERSEPDGGLVADHGPQRHRETSGPVDDAFVYWRDALRGAPLVTQLPIRHGSTCDGGGHPAPSQVVSTLPPDLAARIRTTLPSGLPFELTMLAAFLVLVARYTGQDDLLVGFVNDKPTGRQLGRGIGCHAKPTLVRLILPEDPRFSQVLFAVVNATSGALLHHEQDQEEVIDRLLTRRASEHGLAPRIHVAFEWLEPPDPPTLTVPPSDAPTAMGPVPPLPPVAVQDPPEPVRRATGGEWALEADDDTFFRLVVTPALDGSIRCEGHGVFHPAGGERLLGQYAGLLDQIAANPDLRLSAYSILTRDDAAELETHLAKLSAPRPDVPGLGEEFEAQVRRTPDRPAITGQGLTLTYAQLDAWADRVAQRLRTAHVAPRDRVGLITGPGAAALAAVLGIWKAGATLVAVEVSAGAQRRARVVRESRPRIVLCQNAEAAPLGPSISHLEIPARGGDIDQGHCAREAAGSRGTDLACVFHGQERSAAPAGVMLTHDAVRNLVAGLHQGPYLSPDDGDRPLNVCLDSSPVDDRFYRQLAALYCGHTLVETADDVGPRNEALLGALRDAHVDVVDRTGSTFESLLRDGLGAAMLSREPAAPMPVLVIGSAHPADPDLGRRLLACGPSRVYSVHGPAEACFGATIEEAGRAASGGAPLADLACFVLDRRGVPVPFGAVGELHLSGLGLFRGYYGEPELTKDHLMAVTVRDGSTVHLYKSGQLARWLPGGRLDLLGAVADHLELCGYRIRLRRIEAALAQCPGVGQVALAVRDGGPDGGRLVAYVVPDGTAPTLRELRRFLWTQLPGSIWPAELVVVTRLPRTPDGDLDTSALPAADAPPPLQAETGDGGLTPAEELLAAGWARRLAVPRVSIDSSYWGSFEFLDAVEEAISAGAHITTEQVRRNRTLETLGATLAAAAAVREAQALGPPAPPASTPAREVPA